MRHRLLILSLAAALLLALGAIAPACGGSDESPLEKYFRQLEDILSDANERTSELNLQLGIAFSNPIATDEERSAAIQNSITGIAAILNDVIPDIEDLEPLVEVEEAQNEYLDAAEELEDSLAAAADRLTEVESVDDLFAELFDPESELIAAAGRYSFDACFALQDIADENNIDANLQCGQ